MMTIENAKVTDAMLREITLWQEDHRAGLESDISVIDNAITFIACEQMCPTSGSEEEALSIIADLSFIKRKLRIFAGREDKA